jgi:hypothetical protein
VDGTGADEPEAVLGDGTALALEGAPLAGTVDGGVRLGDVEATTSVGAADGSDSVGPEPPEGAGWTLGGKLVAPQPPSNPTTRARHTKRRYLATVPPFATAER